MAYLQITDFRGGMDRRRSRLAGSPGSLWDLKNAVITRGGEIERSKKFVSHKTGLAGTYGMAWLRGALYVFGSGADPGVPSGVNYMRLQHPNGSTELSAILYSGAFDGKLYVIARFGDDKVFHFYDGGIVTDWIAGIVRSDMADTAGIATHLAALIDADDAYGAVSTGSIIEITSSENEAFEIDTSAINGGTIDDQTLTVNTIQQAVEDVDEVLASCRFRIVGGVASAGVNYISNVSVNGVNVLGANVDYGASAALTAAAVAGQINSHTSSPNYTATASGDTVTIHPLEGTGASPNGYGLSVTTAGAVLITTGGFRITGGSSSPGVNRVTSITVNAIQILNVAVDWTTDNAATATAIAAQINSYNSSPEYIAVASGPDVFVSAVTMSDLSPLNLTLIVTVGGNVTVDPASVVGVSSTATRMSGGVTEQVGQPQITQITVGGTFDVDDKFSINLTTEPTTRNFGADGAPTPIGTTALTFKNKKHVAGGSLVNFSSVGDATWWNRDSNEKPGAGFINVATQDEGLQEVTGLGIYQGQLAVFSEQSIQTWSIDADPGNNVFLDVLQNVGTKSPGSILSYGNNDVFFLDTTGVRSLKARDSSNAAYVSDVGTAIDTFIQEYLATQTDAVIEAAAAVAEPRDGRYWLAIGGQVFVFSYFPESKVSAWSYLDPGFEISAMVRGGKSIYVRAGDTIYRYGGDDGTTYPEAGETPVTVKLPFLAASKLGTNKTATALDLGCTNTWTVDLLPDPNNEATKHRVGVYPKTSYHQPYSPINVESTHFAIELTCEAAGKATLINMALHFKADPNDK